MVRAARSLADESGGRLVDDNGKELDEHALRAIGAELEAVRTRLAAVGIEPGSELALRLFS
jgi:FtsZ-interacting cell division protein ZipA